ncbi:MAG TPA: hypothetical protein VHO69_02940 [Phototrophicaceae bacterium]|nr:hypothetical protein [Phototrophicaceae bacterium]
MSYREARYDDAAETFKMANTDRARKLLVRTALVTSTTMATMIGAQNLAMLDAKQFQPTVTPVVENVAALAPAATPTAVIAVMQAMPEITIVRAAPSIIVLRQSGQVQALPPVVTSGTNPANGIQPPVPAQLAAPDPIIVQQPVPQVSQSTR